jgi:hypothetical protein
VGSNPAEYWMDVSDKASYYIEKKEIQVAKWDSPKKIFFLNKNNARLKIQTERKKAICF